MKITIKHYDIEVEVTIPEDTIVTELPHLIIGMLSTCGYLESSLLASFADYCEEVKGVYNK